MPPKYKDLTDEKFGRLTAKIRLGAADKWGSSLWECQCDCGNIVRVRVDNLTRGITKSCGCLKREVAVVTTKRRNQEDRSLKYGKLVHGGTGTRLFRIWCAMRSRCTDANNPAYKHYGGRGIKICDEWIKDFANFRDWALGNGYKEDLEIDRENNDGNYEPGNCRWVIHQVNMTNTRRSKRNARKG